MSLSHINYQWKIEDTGNLNFNFKTDITDLINKELKKLELIYGPLKKTLSDEKIDEGILIFKFPGVTYTNVKMK